jgi:hypothetical protein
VTQYHVTLNSQGYVLDLDRYVKRIREPFAPKRAAGSAAVGDLVGPEQVLTISDWSGGEGFEQHDPDEGQRHRFNAGVDGYSVPGTLRLGPYASIVGTTTANAVRSLQPYKTKLYAGCTAGLIYGLTTGGVFTLDRTVASLTPQLSMAVFLNVLHYGNSTNGNMGTFDGTTWTDIAGTAGGPIYSLMTHYREAAQYLYAGASAAGTNGVARIYYWTGAAFTLGQFDPEETIPVVMFVLREKLYIVATNVTSNDWALYSVDDGGSGGNWTRHVFMAGRGFPSGALVVDGIAYIGDFQNGRMYRFDGTDLTVAFELGSIASTYAGGLYPTAWRDGLWCGIIDRNATSLGVLRYDPEPSYGGPPTMFRPVTGLAAASYGSDWRAACVWADSLYLATALVGAAKVVKVDVTKYGGAGTLETGLISFGLPGVTKLLRSVTIVTAAMPASCSIQVEYRAEDTGAWTSLGTLSTLNATTATYSFGAGVTCRLLSLRLTLAGVAGGTATPVLHEVAVRYVPRPAVTREWAVGVLLEGTAELPLVTLDGSAEPLTGAQLSAALWAAAGATGPVTLVDLDGTSYAVFVTDVREEMAKISQRRGYQRLGIVSLVEAA